MSNTRSLEDEEEDEKVTIHRATYNEKDKEWKRLPSLSTTRRKHRKRMSELFFGQQSPEDWVVEDITAADD